MALSLAFVMGSMWVFVSNSAVKTPTRWWLSLFYACQTVWQIGEFFHYAVHPDYIGSLPYKLLISVWVIPALAVLEVAYIQFNYLFLHDTYPRERHFMLGLSVGAAALFGGLIVWNEFYNHSDILFLNTTGFLYGSINNTWVLLICLRKAYALRRTDSSRALSISLLNRDGLLLEVADNGPGLDLDLWQRPTTSFGKRLIKGLSEQTGGKLTVENRAMALVEPREVGQIHSAISQQVAAVDGQGALFRLYIPTLKLMR